MTENHNLTNKDIEIFNQLEPLFSFIWTWPFKMFIYLPFDKIALFTGNRAMKTASCAVNYIFRIFGWHPIPKKNVMYFECPKLVEEQKQANKTGDESIITHPWVTIKLGDISELKLHREGEYTDSLIYPDPARFNFKARVKRSVRPSDNRCVICKEHLQIHKRKTRIFRFASEVLPGDKETVDEGGQSTEIKNAVYPEFKKWLPPFLIKDDISDRKRRLIIRDPNSFHNFGDIFYKGADIVVEFVAYQQSVQSGAGVDRLSCWADEESPFDWYEEQMPRLIAEDGDFILSLTPANRITWTFNEFLERAQLYIRTKKICDAYKTYYKEDKPRIEWTDSDKEIAVIQAATDDNPTLERKIIEKKYVYEDEDTILTRRYGFFTQATGRVFNIFNYKLHVIKFSDYLLDPIPSSWTMARSIDYHDRKSWAILWVGISPENEVFIYREWSPSPAYWVNLTIAETIAHKSGMEYYIINLIDPLAKSIQPNTGITVIDDFNRLFYQFKKEGICAGGYWESYDTKGTKGTDSIKERLKNSIKVGKPFNNRVVEDGKQLILPTLWVSRECPDAAKSLKDWRYENWATSRYEHVKDKKEKKAQKYSHYCTALEGILKDYRFRPKRERGITNTRQQPRYFQMAGR